ncbi:MAG: hypothetical protein GY714_23545 [Desulfobacterales bacterium]|nr:hypothetical protein [Desulfobacterales bacterium]
MEFRELEQKLIFVNEEEEKTEVNKGDNVKIVAKETGTIIQGKVNKINARTAEFLVALDDEITFMAQVDPNEIETIEVIK